MPEVTVGRRDSGWCRCSDPGDQAVARIGEIVPPPSMPAATAPALIAIIPISPLPPIPIARLSPSEIPIGPDFAAAAFDADV